MITDRMKAIYTEVTPMRITEAEDDTTHVGHVGDWERGYAKGYERALQQLVELVEAGSHYHAVDDLVRSLAEKLRKEVLNAS